MSDPRRPSRRADLWAEGLAVAAILAVAAYLRLANLAGNPGWYSDEGTLLNIADHFAQGRIQYLAITRSILLAARMPLYPMLVAGLAGWTGGGIIVIRSVSGVLGVLSVAGVYALVRRTQGMNGRWLALASAFMLAVYPMHVIYSRLGFSYNLLGPAYLLVIVLAWDYLGTRRASRLSLAGLVTGLGALSDLTALTFLLPLAVVALYRRPRDLIALGLASAAPLAAFGATMLLHDSPAFLFDLAFIRTRLGAIPLAAQYPVTAFNLAALLDADPWFLVGVAGLFVLPPERFSKLVWIAFWLPFLAVGRSATGLAGLGFYYLLPLLPVLAIGMGRALTAAVPLVLSVTHTGLKQLLARWELGSTLRRWQTSLIFAAGALAVFLFPVGPPLLMGALSVAKVSYGFSTPIDHVLISPMDAEATLAFLRSAVAPDDVVIASPALAWAIPARAADFQQALAADGRSTQNYPANVPRDRFAFDPGFDAADFVVFDRIWDNWAAIYIDGVDDAMATVRPWPMVFHQGEFRVYENPNRLR